ncbi:MAG: polyprenol phosphomannose-dependent alpha 1,6 mannosyltransferase MptB [Pseudonocardia sp.]
MTTHAVPNPASAAQPRAVPPRPERTVLRRLGAPPRTPLLLGLIAAVLLVVGGYGAGGTLVTDPLLTNTALGFWRYGHGRELATALMYIGLALMAYAWVRLGRGVLAGWVGGRAVLTSALAWMTPLLFGPPLLTRDMYSYLAQGALPLAGFDPYAVGPEALPGPLADNVHSFWQDTPAPYGPLFILVAKAVAWVVGDDMIPGILLMRLALLPGLALLVWALPELTRRMGGRIPVALWVAVANPVMVVHLVGGGHNDLLVMGLLAMAALLTLRGQHAGGIALATLAMAVKASAGLALPFLVLIWAARLPGSQSARIARAAAQGVAVFLVVFTACSLAAGVGLGWLPALSAPSMIVNWLSLPTGIGQLLHAIVGIVVNVSAQPFINTMRVIGGIALLALAARLWWQSRDGGPDAVRRAGIVLLAAAVLGPAMLPWYPAWGMALLAMAAWSARWLAVTVFCSLMLLVVFYTNGEAAVENVPYLLVGGLLSLLAAVSLQRPDPLRLRERWSGPHHLVAADARIRGS